MDATYRAAARANDPLTALRLRMRALGVGVSTLREDLWDLCDDVRDPADLYAWIEELAPVARDAGPEVVRALETVRIAVKAPKVTQGAWDHAERLCAGASKRLCEHLENASEEQVLAYWIHAGGATVFGLGGEL